MYSDARFPATGAAAWRSWIVLVRVVVRLTFRAVRVASCTSVRVDFRTEAPTMSDLPESPAAWQRLVERLASLSTRHLLYFRIEVGRATAQELEDDPDGGTLRAFAKAHADRLADLGLNEVLLRQSIAAFRAVERLPEDVVRRLVFSHVVALAKVEDPSTRALLAQAAVSEGWSARQLKDAILAVRAGVWIDGDAGTPGLQPVAPVEPAPKRRVGWVVNRVERQVEDFGSVAAELADITPEALTDLQLTRLRKAIHELKGQLAAAEARLG